MASSNASESARFALNLEGNAAEHASKDAEALERLEGSIQGDIAALRQMQGALRGLQGGAVVNIATMRNLKDQISAQRAKIATNTQAFVDMGGKFRGTKPAAQQAAAGLKELTNALKAAPGPLGQFIGRLGGLRAVLAGGVIVGGIAAIAGAIVLLTAAAAVGTVALVRFGVVQADARRNELLHLEALTKLRIGYMGLFAAQGRATMSGARLQGIIDQVSGGVALARSEVGRYTEQLYRMGLRGATLQDTLEATSIVAATQGDAAAQAFAGWAAGANLTGQSVRKLTDDVRARLGPIARAQMLSLSVQSMKLRENLSLIFAGAKVEKFLGPLKEVLDIFSQQAAVGRALKSIVTAIFGGLGEQISPLGLVVKRFFQGITIGLLVIGIQLLKARKWWREAFGDSTTLKNFDLARTAVWAGVGAVFGLAGAFAALGTAMAAPIAGLVLVAKWLEKITRPARAAVDAILAVKDAFKEAGAAGGKGIAAGLTSGRLGVADAARILGDTAVKAFKKKLGIESPSRVLMREGLQVGAGAAGGIMAARPQVARATARLADVIPIGFRRERERAAAPRIATPIEAPAATAPAARGGGGRAPIMVNLTIQKVEIHAGSGGGAELESAIRKGLTEALRGVAVHIGAVVNGTNAEGEAA